MDTGQDNLQAISHDSEPQKTGTDRKPQRKVKTSKSHQRESKVHLVWIPDGQLCGPSSGCSSSWFL